jgi:hypothetical protein
MLQVQPANEVASLLQDLVEPLRVEMAALKKASAEVIRAHEQASRAAWRAGRILLNAHTRTKKAGRRLKEFYTWAQQEYSSYQINVCLNIAKNFKSEDQVEGLTIEDCKEICGMSTQRQRRASGQKRNPQTGSDSDSDSDSDSESGSESESESESGSTDLGTETEGNARTRGEVPFPSPEGEGDGSEDVRTIDTSKLLLRIAEVFESVSDIVEEDFVTLNRIEAHSALLRESFAENTEAELLQASIAEKEAE